MPSGQVIRVSQADDSVAAASLRAGISQLQGELEVTATFPPAVVAEAAHASGQTDPHQREDHTDVPFVTVDPVGSMDLDQAFHLTRTETGFVVDYAIADVHTFVTPGGEIDTEAQRRGESLYGADSKIPLHPTELSEGAASLLPDQIRPVLLWTTTLDPQGQILDTRVRRASIRSVAKLDYAGLQAQLDSDTDTGTPYAASVALLPEIGRLRIEAEIARGGIDLPLPDQEIEVVGEHWRLAFRSQLPVERWNAQLSLLTGFGAARIMLDHKVGLLRTLPPADPRDVARLRRTAHALGIEWPAEQPVPDFIRGLDPAHSRQAAMVVAATRLLRGSGYTAFNGTLPDLTEHAALASPYAHVTAPLRRLVDRYAGEICVALCAGETVPAWVLTALDTLPETMQASGRRASAYERGILDLVEAGILAPQVGETFEAVVVDVNEKDPTRGSLSLRDPAVEAGVRSSVALPLGDPITATLTQADVATRKVAFTFAGGAVG